MKPNGKLITFEGIEGCGKTTQSRLLFEHLGSMGVDVILSREPGGTELGDRIRDLLLHVRDAAIDAKTEAMLYAASRAQLVREVIEPALARGTVVILDRYVDSTYAYQIYGRGLDAGAVRMVNEWAIGAAKPDLTFLLELDVEKGLGRLEPGMADRIEAESQAFHERVSAGFEALAAAEPGRFRILKGSESAEMIHNKVMEHVVEVVRFVV